jgi:hypothetical protein
MWLQLGGQHTGAVREGSVPAGLKPVLSHESPTLAEVIRDINKFSNNVMADQLFLTLGAQQRGRGNATDAAEVVQTWWRERLPLASPPALDKGSGLSRDARVSAQSLAALLQWAWAQGFMPELVSSLPITGLDGTLKRSKSTAMAHVKTGSLRVLAITSPKRLDLLPNIPAVGESIAPGFDFPLWGGVFGSSKIPKDILSLLNREINKAIDRPEVQAKLTAQYSQATKFTPSEFSDFLKADADRYRSVIREAKISID